MPRGRITLTLGMLADLLGMPEDMAISAVRLRDVADGPVELLVECPRLPQRPLYTHTGWRHDRPEPWEVHPQWHRHDGIPCSRPHIHLDLLVASQGPVYHGEDAPTMYSLGEPVKPPPAREGSPFAPDPDLIGRDAGLGDKGK